MSITHVDMVDDHLRRPLPKKHAPHRIDGYACHHMLSAAFWNLQPMHLDQIWFCKQECSKAWTEAAIVPGVKVRDLTGLKWPSRECMNFPVGTSKIATVPSWLPHANLWPFGLNATLSTNLSFLNFSSACTHAGQKLCHRPTESKYRNIDWPMFQKSIPLCG